MKILVQCNYDPNNLGGIEAVTRQLLNLLKNRNITIEVISSSNSDITTIRDGYTYQGMKILRKVSGTPILRWGNLRFLRAGLRSDIILFQEPFPTLLPALIVLRFVLQKRVIVLVHAIPYMPPVLAKIYDWARTFLLRRVQVVATSPVLLKQLRIEGHSVQHVIPLCFEETAIVNSASRYDDGSAEMLELPELPQRYMLFFGRLAGYKGLDILMHTIAAAPEVQFVIAGSGQQSEFVADFISRHTLKNVIFINKLLSDAEKFNLIKNCYCFILPSVNSSEAFAIVQLEAMYFCKPIINTQLNNGVNYVAPHNVAALTVPPNNIDCLTIAVLQIWRDKNLAMALGRAGKTRLSNLFSSESFQKSWSDYFDSIGI